MEATPEQLGLEHNFCFDCHKEIGCFNTCCRDLNQFLTPYDILRIKQGLGLTSNQFLKAYTHTHTGPETGLPVITLNSNAASHFECPFLTSTGCEIYDDRPSACRTYPLIRLASRDRDTKQIEARYFLLKETHCMGHFEPNQQIVQTWVRQQGLEPYNLINDLFIEVIALKNQLGLTHLSNKQAELFHMDLYDTDRLCREIISGQPLPGWKPQNHDRQFLTEQPAGVLQLGIKWLIKTRFWTNCP